MPRAYLRLDPAFDERKESYPDGPYAALVATFCLAELQPQRGRFRSLDYLSRMLGKRGRHARYLVEHGDLTILDDGRVYVDGWDEWQEGDWKVSERVHRIRNRKSVTPDVTVPVTVDVTPDVTALRQSVSGSGKRSISGGADSEIAREDGLPHITPEAQRLIEGLTGKLITTAGDKQLTEYDRQLEAHGLAKVSDAYRRVAGSVKNPTYRQLIWSALRVLEPFTTPQDIAKVEAQTSSKAAIERTRAYIDSLRDTA